MRLSPQRHTLAVLRILLNLTQKEMAELAGCSRPTIQAVELGKLKLSFDLAQRINLATGVSNEWLLAADVSRPPVSTHGKPYTKELFEQRRADQLSSTKSGFSAVGDFWKAREFFVKNVKVLAILYSEAFKEGKAPIVFYKSLMSAKEIFEKEIPEHPHIAEKLKPLTYSDIGPIDLFALTETLDEFEGETSEELRRKLKKTKEPIPPFLQKLVPVLTKRTRRARKKK